MGVSVFTTNSGKLRACGQSSAITSRMGLLIVISAFSVQGCSKTSLLDPLVNQKVINNSAQAVTVNFCTDPAVQQKYVEKMIIILDHSGSNQDNYKIAPVTGLPDVSSGAIVHTTNYATDPQGTLRYGSVTSPGTLLNYLATTPLNNMANPQRYFSLIDFSDNTSSYPADGSFSYDLQAFYNYVAADATSGSNASGPSPNDAGSTNYLKALQAAYWTINTDIQNGIACAKPTATLSATCLTPGVEVASSYVIVFASDGAPIISLGAVSGTPGNYSIAINEQTSDQILSEVQAIVGLTSNSKFVTGINLFTVYYYNPTNQKDTVGQALLAQMATVGAGLSYSAVSGTHLNYNSFVPPTKVIKNTLSDVFVTNASTVWWTDGNLHLDTDMDGLPDDIELMWGSDPTKAYSKNNGISDLVRYKLANGGADNPIDYVGNGRCASLNPATVGGKKVYPSSDPDGLNDCEKIILNNVGGIDNPDSNGDILPDWLEFINGIAFQLGSPSASSLTQTDGTSAYTKIKESLPVNVPLNHYLNLTPSNYVLTQLSTSSVQDCYKLEVTGLPTIGSQNTVRVDVVEKSELLQDAYLYRVGRKQFPIGSSTLNFNDWNNAAEIGAGTWKKWP